MKRSISQRVVEYWQKGYLYVFTACVVYFAWFLSNNVGILDWIKEISYFEYFKISFSEYHSLPYFWWNILEEVAWRPPIPGTSALIANPETALFSPFMPLLYLFEVQTFMKLYIIIQFFIGVLGSFRLRKKLNWNNSQFRIFIVLFLFSPIVLQHIAVAYFTWYNFFLLPWLIFFMAEKNTIKSIIGVSAVLGLVVLQGGIYIVQYLGMFFVVYEVFHVIIEKDWKRSLRIVFVPLLALILSLARLLPTALVYGEYVRPWVETEGYNLPFFLFYALIPTITIPPLDLLFHSDFLGWSLTPHDSGLFWGLSLIMLLSVFFKYRTIITNPLSDRQSGLNYHAIFISATLMLVVSFYHIWYFAMQAISALDLPLFESIKNHGIRFIMGAFFVYAILLSNYSNEIWKVLQKFVETRFWNILKDLSVVFIKGLMLLLGTIILGLKIFNRAITEKTYRFIEDAYNGTGGKWLVEKMEGMQLNTLEFYYRRFDVLSQELLGWMKLLFMVVIILFLISYIIKKNRYRTGAFLQNNPYFKFEMALAIPLILSMSMWANLAASVPFDSLKTLPLLPPEIDIISTEDTNSSTAIIEATPSRLTIKPENASNVDEYLFPRIAARDTVWFDVVSGNANLSEKNGKMSVKPMDGGTIQLDFKKDKVLLPLYITILAWITVISYFLISIYLKNKAKQQINETR